MSNPPHQPPPEPDTTLPSGEWRGYFVQNGTRFPMSLHLRFDRDHLCGEGSDAVGKFKIVGTYHGRTQKVDFRKHYLGEYMVLYGGMRGPGPCLQGQWLPRSSGLTGFWRIWPAAKKQSVKRAAAKHQWLVMPKERPTPKTRKKN